MANPFQPDGYRGNGAAKGNQIYHFNAGPDIRVKQPKRIVPLRSTISRGLASTPLSQEIHHRNQALTRSINGSRISPGFVPSSSLGTPMDGVATEDNSLGANFGRTAAPLTTLVSPIAHATVNLAATLGSAFVGWWSRNSGSSGAVARSMNNKAVEERPLSYFAEQPFGRFGVPDNLSSTSTMDGGGVPPSGYFQQPNIVAPSASARDRVRARRTLLPASVGSDQLPTNSRTSSRADGPMSAPSTPVSSSSPAMRSNRYRNREDLDTEAAPRSTQRVPDAGLSPRSERRHDPGTTTPRTATKRATLQLYDFDGNNSDREQQPGSSQAEEDRIDDDDDDSDTFVTPPTSPILSSHDTPDSNYAAMDENAGTVTPRGSRRFGSVNGNSNTPSNQAKAKKRPVEDDEADDDGEQENAGGNATRVFFQQSPGGISGLFTQSNTPDKTLPSRSEQPLQFLSPVPSLSEFLRERPSISSAVRDNTFNAGGSRTLDEFNLTKLPSFYVRRAEVHRKKLKREPTTGSTGGSGNYDTRSPSSMSYASSLFSGHHQPASYQPSTAATFRTDILKSIHNNFRSPLLQDIIITGVQQRGVGVGSVSASITSKKAVRATPLGGFDGEAPTRQRQNRLDTRQSYGILNASERTVAGANSTIVSGIDGSPAPGPAATAAPMTSAIQFLYITERQNDAPLDVSELLEHAAASSSGTVGVHNKFTGQTMQVNETILRAFISYRAMFSSMKQTNPHFFAVRCQETDAQADAAVKNDVVANEQQTASANASSSSLPSTGDAGTGNDTILPSPSRTSVHQRLGPRQQPSARNAGTHDSTDAAVDSTPNAGPSSTAQPAASQAVFSKLSQQTFNSTPEAFLSTTQQKQQRPVIEELTKEQYKDRFSFGKPHQQSTPTKADAQRPPSSSGFDLSAAQPEVIPSTSTPQVAGFGLPATSAVNVSPNTSIATASKASDMPSITISSPTTEKPDAVFGAFTNTFQQQHSKPPEVTSASAAPAAASAVTSTSAGGFNFGIPSSTSFSATGTTPGAASTSAVPVVFGGGVGLFPNAVTQPATTQSATLPTAVTTASAPFNIAPFGTPSAVSGTTTSPSTAVSFPPLTFSWGKPPAATTATTAQPSAVAFGSGTVTTPAVNGGGFGAFNFSGNAAAAAPAATTTTTTPPFAFGSFTATPTTAPTAAFGIGKSTFGAFGQPSSTAVTSAINNTSSMLPNGTSTAPGGVSVFRYANPGAAGSAPNLATTPSIFGAPAASAPAPAPFGGGGSMAFGAPAAGGIRPNLFNFGGSATPGTQPAFGSGGASTAPFTFGQPQQQGGALQPSPQPPALGGGGLFRGGSLAAVGPTGGTATVASMGGGGLYSDSARRKLQARRTHSRHR